MNSGTQERDGVRAAHAFNATRVQEEGEPVPQTATAAVVLVWCMRAVVHFAVAHFVLHCLPGPVMLWNGKFQEEIPPTPRGPTENPQKGGTQMLHEKKDRGYRGESLEPTIGWWERVGRGLGEDWERVGRG